MLHGFPCIEVNLILNPPLMLLKPLMRVAARRPSSWEWQCRPRPRARLSQRRTLAGAPRCLCAHLCGRECWLLRGCFTVMVTGTFNDHSISFPKVVRKVYGANSRFKAKVMYYLCPPRLLHMHRRSLTFPLRNLWMASSSCPLPTKVILILPWFLSYLHTAH